MGIPYKRANALASYALTFVALNAVQHAGGALPLALPAQGADLLGTRPRVARPAATAAPVAMAGPVDGDFV